MMEESKRRKVYHHKSTYGGNHNTDVPHIISIQGNKYFPSKRKLRSKHSKSKRTKRWHSINHTTLNHSRKTSTYIAPERITKQVGFLTKGKTSNSISRLEKIVPDEVKARANQDLHGILKLVNEYKVPDDPYECNFSDNNAGSGISNSYVSPVRGCFTHNLEFPNSKNIELSSLSVVEKNESVYTNDEMSIVKGTIKNRLHVAVSRVNKRMFPAASNQKMLINDILFIQRQYDVNKRAPSSSSNCDSSQDIQRMEVGNDDFKLNPILTEEKTCSVTNLKNEFELNPVFTPNPNTTSKDLVNMFPSMQVSSSSEEYESEEDFSSPDNDERQDNFSRMQPPILFEKRSVDLDIPSSLNNSPVWVPVTSPSKFIPDFPPTPKIFFRQKMF